MDPQGTSQDERTGSPSPRERKRGVASRLFPLFVLAALFIALRMYWTHTPWSSQSILPDYDQLMVLNRLLALVKEVSLFLMVGVLVVLRSVAESTGRR